MKISLTENFKGRIQERKALKEFSRSGKGNLMIWGSSGAGKSALMAQVLKEIKEGANIGKSQERAQYPPIIEYFIQKGSESTYPAKFLSYLISRMNNIFQLNVFTARENEYELWKKMVEAIDRIEDSKGKHSLVLLIDGLDECPDICKFIPDSRTWLKIILSSRPVKPIIDWLQYWNSENKTEMNIPPLNQVDIRALLYGLDNKYQGEFDDAYVLKLEKASEGNPLYLKLFCGKIFEKRGPIDPFSELPKGIVGLYEEAIDRLTMNGTDQKVLDFLCLFAEAKTSISLSVAGEILKMSHERVQLTIESCRELFYEECPLPGLFEYQLFHESLREWLKASHPEKCNTMREKLADFCFSWKKAEKKDERKYALMNAADHLFDMGDHERIWELLKDEEYRETQINTLNQYQPAFNALKKGIDLFIRRQNDDPKLCWLALRAGELASQAKNEFHMAFKGMEERPLDDPDRVNDALALIEVLEEEEFFKAALLLLWIEADRQKRRNKEDRQDTAIRQILDAVERKIPPESGTVDWGRFLAPAFMAWLSKHLLSIFPQVELLSLVRRVSDISDYVNKCLREFPVGNLAENKEFVELTLAAANQITEKEIKNEIILHAAELLAKEGNLDQAQKIINHFKKSEKKAEAFLIEVWTLLRTKEWKKALACASQIETSSKKSEALFSVAVTLAQLRDFPQALAIADRMKFDFRKIQALDHIRKSALQGGEIELSENLSNRLLERVRKIQDKDEKGRALHALSCSFSQSNQKELAKELFDEALRTAKEIDDEIQKHLLTFHFLSTEAKSSYHSGNAVLAKETLNQAWAQIKNPEMIKRLRPAAVEALGSIGEFPKAFSLIQEFGPFESKAKADALSDIVVALAEKGEYQQALAAVDHYTKAKKAERSLTMRRVLYPYEDGYILTNLARFLGQSRDSSLAKKIYMRIFLSDDSSVQFQEKENALFMIGNILVESGEFSEALTAANNLTNIMEKDSLFLTLSRKLSDSGDISQALKVLDLITNEEGKSNSLEIIVKSLAKAANIRKALFWATRIKYPKYAASAFSAIGLSLANSGREKSAEKIYRRVLELVAGMEEGEGKSWAIWTIADSLVQAGDFGLKKNLFNQIMELIDHFQKDDHKSKALEEIVSSFIKSGNIQAEFDLFRQGLKALFKIKDDPNKIHALSSIILLMIQTDLLPQFDFLMRELLQEMDRVRDVDCKAHCFSDIFSGIINSTYADLTKFVLQKCLAAAYQCEDEGVKAAALFTIGMGLFRIREVKLAYELLEKSIRTAIHIPEELSYIQYSLALGGLKLPEFKDDTSKRLFADQILTIAKKVGKGLRKNKVLSAIADILAEYDMPKETMELIKFMDGESDDEKEREIPEVIAKKGDVLGGLISASRIQDDAGEIEILSRILEFNVPPEKIWMVNDFARMAQLPLSVWQEVLPKWRARIKLNWPESLSWIRSTLGYFPFDLGLAYNGAYSLCESHLKSGNREIFETIIRRCPQLGLEFFMKMDRHSD